MKANRNKEKKKSKEKSSCDLCCGIMYMVKPDVEKRLFLNEAFYYGAKRSIFQEKRKHMCMSVQKKNRAAIKSK